MTGYIARCDERPIQWNRRNRYGYIVLPRRLLMAINEHGIILGHESRYTVSMTLTLGMDGKPVLTIADWEPHPPHYRKSHTGRRAGNIPQGYAPWGKRI